MRTTHTEIPLPRVFGDHPKMRGLLGECDVKVSKCSKLRAKVLVFDTRKHMRAFWRDILGRDIVCGKTRGICCTLARNVYRFDKDGTEHHVAFEVDKRYFCIIGLLRDHLGMEVVCHESVHAGFAYVARIRRREWTRNDLGMMDEEEVAYPAGAVAARILSFLYENGLYDRKKAEKPDGT